MCDSRVTENVFHFAAFGVNKICLKCIFYSSWLVMRMQKYGATVSITAYRIFCIERTPRLGHRWSVPKKPKCEVFSWWASWLLMVRDQPYLWIDFFEEVSASIDGIMMAVERWGFNWKGQAQGVRGDTLKPFLSTSIPALSLPNEWIPLSPTCAYM